MNFGVRTKRGKVIALLVLVLAIGVALCFYWTPTLRFLRNNYEYLLVAVTMFLGVAAIFPEKPSTKWRAAFVATLMLQLGLTLLKVSSDNADKELVQDLALSNLALPNNKVVEVKEAMNRAFGEGGGDSCWQWSVGLSCQMPEARDKPAGILVMNRYEVASVFAKLHRGLKDDASQQLQNLRSKTFEPVIDIYAPKTTSGAAVKKLSANDEFMDKLGILAFLAYFAACDEAAAHYTYHRSNGVGLQSHKGTWIPLLRAEDINKLSTDKEISGIAAFTKLKSAIVKEIGSKGTANSQCGK